MKIQRIVWLVGRIMYYSALFLLLAFVIYTLAHDQWMAALVIGTLFLVTLYVGLIRIKIPAYSLVVRQDKVVFFIPEKTVGNRFDFVSRGQTIVELPHYGLLDRPYKLEIFSSDGRGGISACRLTLHLDYLLEETAWQRAYDSFVVHQERLSLEVRKLLLKSSAGLTCQPVPPPDAEAIQEFLKPIIAELNRGLESVGLNIEEATCSFSTGTALARFVAPEQELMEKSAGAAAV